MQDGQEIVGVIDERVERGIGHVLAVPVVLPIDLDGAKESRIAARRHQCLWRNLALRVLSGSENSERRLVHICGADKKLRSIAVGGVQAIKVDDDLLNQFTDDVP